MTKDDALKATAEIFGVNPDLLIIVEQIDGEVFDYVDIQKFLDEYTYQKFLRK